MSRATSRQLRKTFSNLRFKARVVVAQLPELFVPGERKVLNLGEIDQDDSEELSNCLALVSQLTKYMQWMKAEFMSDNGHCVDYRSLKDSTLFGQYTRACRRLREADLSELTDAERKAFFLNVYNVLTLHGMVGHARLPSSPLEVRGFWRRTCYDIGGLVYSLDDIEHGLLRGNRQHSGKVPFKKEDDPRRRFSHTVVDPRIHFALVCGAKSCPAISVFTAENVERALDGATKTYVQQEISINVYKHIICLPRIFSWYGQDFGDTKEEIIQWCSQYMSKQQLFNLELMNDMCFSSPIEMQFTDYNWRLNALPPKQAMDDAEVYRRQRIQRQSTATRPFITSSISAPTSFDEESLSSHAACATSLQSCPQVAEYDADDGFAQEYVGT
ncbi:uncharacterized protein LOC135830122 [Sycon ciliatum]|uniref:uncharacterized protein LOC135830122 n=1 Tax=Sycon ciliatum TaxID=27933 RepID=UPI0031F721EE